MSMTLKETWKLVVRILDIWSDVVVYSKGNEHLEMVMMDSKLLPSVCDVCVLSIKKNKGGKACG